MNMGQEHVYKLQGFTKLALINFVSVTLKLPNEIKNQFILAPFRLLRNQCGCAGRDMSTLNTQFLCVRSTFLSDRARTRL